MSNHEGALVGVLQLVNAKDAGGQIGAFSATDQRYFLTEEGTRR